LEDCSRIEEDCIDATKLLEKHDPDREEERFHKSSIGQYFDVTVPLVRNCNFVFLVLSMSFDSGEFSLDVCVSLHYFIYNNKSFNYLSSIDDAIFSCITCHEDVGVQL